jgi:hypothetical protein
MVLPKQFLRCTFPGCTRAVDTRRGRYLWLGRGWRGRCAARPRNIQTDVLCPEHGELVLQTLEKLWLGMGVFQLVRF